MPVMRAPAFRGVKRIILITPSQAGKSNAIFNIVGSTLDDEPRPILYIAPSKSLAMSVVEPKIDDMIRDCESLWDVTLKGKKYTRAVKRINGVQFRLAWGGSTKELKGDTAAVVFVDELDEFEPDINNQGGIMELADARHGAYENGLTFAASTPTEGNIETYEHKLTGIIHWQVAALESVISQIWRAWQAGTRHEFAWPCFVCREYFIPRFADLKFDSKASQKVIEASAYVECPHCSAHLNTRTKSWMNDHGLALAPGQYFYPYVDGDEGAYMVDAHAHGSIPERDDPAVEFIKFGDFRFPSEVPTRDFSLWASGLCHYSMARTFGTIAWSFLRAARGGDPNSVKGVVNTVLGECVRFGGEAPKPDAVAARKTGYKIGDVPEEVTQVFVTADVQADRVPFVVRGWGADGQSWLLDYGELWGDTQDMATLRQLNHYLQQTYDGVQVRAAAMDSGFRALHVYDYCRENLGLLVPTKGEPTLDKHFYPSNVDVRPDGKTVKFSVTLWHINTDMAKSWVHSRMITSDDKTGAWWLPADISDYYLRQIVAEQRMAKPSGKISWHQTGRNDFLDCEAMQWFLFKCLGPVAARPVAKDAQLPGNGGARQLSRGIEI